MKKLQEVTVKYACGCTYRELWHKVTQRELKEKQAQTCELCRGKN